MKAVVWIQRGLSEDEFKAIRGTTMFLRMLKSRIGISVERSTEGNMISNAAMVRTAAEKWCHANCMDIYFVGKAPSGYGEIFFLNPLDAVNFRLAWADREVS
jgi:hypothetical protein